VERQRKGAKTGKKGEGGAKNKRLVHGIKMINVVVFGKYKKIVHDGA
jgi:hypothetical protein